MPIVSVIIPLYNSERTVGETLRSVLAQSLRDFEVIVVNDGSTDHGVEVVRTFPDPRVRLVHQENRGLAGARNTGIRHAAGRYLALIDADDLWHPEKLAEHVRLLDADPGIGVAFSQSRLIDNAGTPLGLIQSPATLQFSAAEVFCRNPIGNGSAPVLRRAVFDDIVFHDTARGRLCWFDESFRQSEDIECWTRIAATTRWRFGYIAKPLTDYRITGVGLSADTTRQLETWRRFRGKVAAYAPALERSVGSRAEAYQLRYLARRAVRSADRAAAFDLVRQALALYPAMLREEPLRTATTLAAATLHRLLPAAFFDTLVGGAQTALQRAPKLRV
jgi:glycosyltransferase involved in cell wall biosynthesis